MLQHIGLPRYSVVGPTPANNNPPPPAPGNTCLTRLPANLLPQYNAAVAAAATLPMQMYLQGIAQRETMLRNAFADYLKPVCTADGEVLLDVECGENRGMLYLSRFCQGSKGPCIRFEEMWLTPNEFQYISGRESAKDWKRSIRHQGKSLKLLLAKGILTVHQSSCSCTGCRISSPVNRGKLANCNPRFGYENMFDFSEKPLPHMFGNFQSATHDPDADDNPLSPSNPSHSSKESSDFSSGESKNYRATFPGVQENIRHSKGAGDSLYERRTTQQSLSVRTTFSGVPVLPNFSQFRPQPSGELGRTIKDEQSRDVCPGVYRPVAQMFPGMRPSLMALSIAENMNSQISSFSATQNVELMQSLLRGSGCSGPAISTQASAFYPVGLVPNHKSSKQPSLSSVSSNSSPSPPPASSPSNHTSSAEVDSDESKTFQPLDLTTSGKVGGKMSKSSIKPSNPPPGAESPTVYGSRPRDKTTPYSRPTTTTITQTKSDKRTTPSPVGVEEQPASDNSSEGQPDSLPVWLGRRVYVAASPPASAAAAKTTASLTGSEHDSEEDSEMMDDCERSRSI